MRALDLRQLGWPQKEIARSLGVSEGAVSQWMRRLREGGPEALRHRRPPGKAPRLSPEARTRLKDLLALGPGSFGFDRWTCARASELVLREFGVSLHPAHMSRVLRRCGFELRAS